MSRGACPVRPDQDDRESRNGFSPRKSNDLTASGKLLTAKVLIWDFDGVIKETLDVKGEAFAGLFAGHSKDLRQKIKSHHEANGGMSRFEKIPLYLTWAGLPADGDSVRQFCLHFSEAVFRKVLEAGWVPGAKEILSRNPFRQTFHLVTATPQEEIERVMEALDLRKAFQGIWGAPTPKGRAVEKILSLAQVKADECLFLGDALADWEAARATNIPFLLRRHKYNHGIPEFRSLPSLPDFLNL